MIIYLVPGGRYSPAFSCCGIKRSGYDILKSRHWKHVLLWGILVTLVYSARRVQCTRCVVKVEAIPGAQWKSLVSLPLIGFLPN